MGIARDEKAIFGCFRSFWCRDRREIWQECRVHRVNWYGQESEILCLKYLTSETSNRKVLRILFVFIIEIC